MPAFFTVLGLPLLACLVMVSILAALGIHVLKREVIFIDIALAQIAAVGAIAAGVILKADHHSLASSGVALAAVLAAALFYAVVRRTVHRIPIEAVIGISYGIAAAGALFLAGIAPGGHVHVQQMLAGSILWANGTDLTACAVTFAAVGLCLYLARRPLGRISEDYAGALAAGMRVLWWDFLFYALAGVVVTLSVELAGVVVVFALLIIPAAVSALLATSWRARLAVAWSTGAAASLGGLLFAQRLDFSVGPSVALFLGIIVALAALWRRGGTRLGGSLSLAAAGGFAALLLLSPPAGPPPPVGRTSLPSRSPPSGAGGSAASRAAVVGPADSRRSLSPAADLERRVAEAKDAAALVRLYAGAAGPDVQSDIVRRALEVSPARGARLALEFLRGDPPLFFRQVAIDALSRLDPPAGGFDAAKPFSAPENQAAAAALRSRYRERAP